VYVGASASHVDRLRFPAGVSALSLAEGVGVVGLSSLKLG